MMYDVANSAIIVAAGSGSRFGSGLPKQFWHLAGKTVIVHTLEKFQACPDIDEIVLVLSENGRTLFERAVGERSFSKLTKLVAGGATRAESVKNGLDHVHPECEIVAVHDGARPLVAVDEITATIQRAADTGAACLVAEVTDTIKKVGDGEIRGTVDRCTLRRALTPQAFRVDILRRAFENAEPNETITDECYLLEQLGVAIAYVDGSSRNIKITREDDLEIAKALLAERSAD
ncbi:MAG: 2-C-methyl-D-erythritol 4-phosphate cytidylyltransferase [Acidobacteria bacterium]|nr:2-C-methyl-D-erythritol 4-phosphate cytidylyltransferase [Acidobacteriota bacterium]